VSDNVAYMRRQDGEIVCTYLGFNNKHKAKRWGDWLTLTHNVANKCEARRSKRLTAFKYELKLWGVTMAQIDKLAACDLRLDPRSAATLMRLSASQREHHKPHGLPRLKILE